MLSQDLTRVAPSSEALIRVYRDRLVFNHTAVSLLGLNPDAKVAFRHNPQTARVYVGVRDYSSYRTIPCGKRLFVRSRDLCKKLASALEGYGTYRIESEDCEKDFNDNIYYQIFFKKYDSK